MTKVKIYVSRDRETGKLRFLDSEGHEGDSITTLVSPGDEVEWVLGEGIDKIEGIYPINGSLSIFQGSVHENGNGSWKGTVSETAQGSEEYAIKYIADSATYSSNPILKVKPPR